MRSTKTNCERSMGPWVKSLQWRLTDYGISWERREKKSVIASSKISLKSSPAHTTFLPAWVTSDPDKTKHPPYLMTRNRYNAFCYSSTICCLALGKRAKESPEPTHYFALKSSHSSFLPGQPSIPSHARRLARSLPRWGVLENCIFLIL